MIRNQIVFVLFFICNIDARVLELDLVNTTSEIEWVNEVASDQILNSEPSLGTAIVNTQVLTIFNYRGSQIYLYSALSNDPTDK